MSSFFKYNKMKKIYIKPITEVILFNTNEHILNGSTSTAMTIVIVDFGESQLEDGGLL